MTRWGGASFRACSAEWRLDPVTIQSTACILHVTPLAESYVVAILVWSNNRILSGLVTRNLVRRGFDVRERPLPTAGAPWEASGVGDDVTLGIVDLDCQEPELWRRAARVRKIIPGIPLVILGHAWPATAQLDRLQPCIYVRKPFAIDVLVAAVQESRHAGRELSSRYSGG
jgi:hypothetical protein